MPEKIAIGPNGERIIYRLAINEETGDEAWVKVPDYIGGANSPYQEVAKKMSGYINNILSDDRDSGVKLQDELAQSLPPFPIGADFNSDFPFIHPHLNDARQNEHSIQYGRVGTGFMSGLKSTGLKTAGVIANEWGKEYPNLVNPEIGLNLYMSALNEDARREKEQKLMEGFDRNSGIGAISGGMPLYMLTSALAGPMTKKLAGSTLDAIESTANLAKAESRSALTKVVDAAANSDDIGLKWFGKRAQSEWTKPLAEAKSIASKQKPFLSDYRKGLATDILGSTILGGIEGTLNSDLDAKSGALAGLSGSLLGRSLKYKLEPAPLPSNNAYNELMNKRKSWGRRNTPGEILDNPALQTMEHGIRNSDRTSYVMKKFDDANRMADNAYAFKAMGYEGDIMDKASLNKYTKSLSDDYETLAGKTTARLEKADLTNLQRHTASLTKRGTDESIAASKAANEWLVKLRSFRDEQNRVRRNNGQFDNQASGKTWQDYRSELKEDIKSAFANNNPKVGRALKPFLDTLNNAADRGITRLGRTPEEGKQILANWKDLDEKYAMSKILKEHGMDDVTMNVNPTKLYNYFRTEDPERLITGNYGKNGRINALYDIAEGRPIELEQAGSSISGLNVKDKGEKVKDTLTRKLFQSPDYQKPGFIDELSLRMYLSPTFSPAVHGYSFGLLNGKGPRTAVNLARSFSQSSQMTPGIVNSAIDAKNWVEDKYNSAQQGLDTIWKAIQNMSGK